MYRPTPGDLALRAAAAGLVASVLGRVKEFTTLFAQAGLLRFDTEGFVTAVAETAIAAASGNKKPAASTPASSGTSFGTAGGGGKGGSSGGVDRKAPLAVAGEFGSCGSLHCALGRRIGGGKRGEGGGGGGKKKGGRGVALRISVWEGIYQLHRK